MSLQAKTFLNLIAGALAGAFAWALTDATGWYARTLEPLRFVGLGQPGYGLYLLYGAIFGLLLGLLLGIVESLALDSARQIGMALTLGALVGFVGGGLGLHLGQTLYGLLGGVNDATAANAPGRFVANLFARAFGWMLIGGTVGAVQGISRRSSVIARQGAFGGLIGGFLGGTLFQLIANLLITLPGNAILARLAALVATGGLAGFFIGFVQNALKSAWIRVVVGKNEGKEYLISKPLTTIGRDELADIGLFGDKAIAPTHAVIESLPAQRRHRLRHVAPGQGGGPTYPPTRVNGQPVTAEQWLADGDTIQIGKRALVFYEKATRGAPRSTPISNPPGPARFAGQELEGSDRIVAPSVAPARPALTPSDDILAQMGTVPEPSPVLAPSGGLGTRLTCLAGPYAGQSFPLSHAPTTLGRSADRDIALPADTSVSRAHARIIYQNGRHAAADDGSSNGTLVNGARLSALHILSAGDTIQMGDTVLRYE